MCGGAPRIPPRRGDCIPQGNADRWFGRGHRDRRHETSLDDRRRKDPVAVENIALAGLAGTALPIHTIVRGRFIMKDRMLNEAARGTGRSVHAISRCRRPHRKNADATMAVITSARRL